MKKLKENNSSQAIHLREAAIAFYLSTQKTSGNGAEEARERKNRDLLEAALAYARIADPVLKDLDASVKEIEKFIGTLMDANTSDTDLVRSYAQAKKVLRGLKLRRGTDASQNQGGNGLQRGRLRGGDQ